MNGSRDSRIDRNNQPNRNFVSETKAATEAPDSKWKRNTDGGERISMGVTKRGYVTWAVAGQTGDDGVGARAL